MCLLLVWFFMVRYAQLDISNLNLSEGKVALKGELGQLRCEKALQLTYDLCQT
ncbi:MAG: hypothetical protein R2865_12090 [Deinococcales bacterium]